MGQGEREFTRRGKIHETRSKASNTARTGPTGGRRDRLSRFTRGDHARLASGGHQGQPSPSPGGKNLPCQGCSSRSGTGAGGRSGGGDAWTRAWEETHLTSRWTQPSGTTRYARSVRGSLASAATIPIATLLGPGNEQADDRSETARHRNPMRSSSTAKPAQKTHNQPAKSRPVLHDWFDPGCRRGASARGIPTDEAECSEAGHPRGICAIPERVGPETCRRSRR